MILTLLNGDKRLVNVFGNMTGLKIKHIEFSTFEMARIARMHLIQKNALKLRIKFAMSVHTSSKRVKFYEMPDQTDKPNIQTGEIEL